jgi:hypothetical protein
MGYAITSLGGTILHFLYDWSGKSRLVAVFSGVNESTWEHMKLLFWPMFLFAIAESFFFKDVADFWCIKLKGTLLGLALIPIIFYTYNGVVGKSPDWLNIAIFFVSAAIAYIFETRRLNSGKSCLRVPRMAFTALCIIALLFAVFTFAPPRIELFKDPLTSTYGI